METKLVGNKSQFAIEAIIYSKEDRLNTDIDGVFWGDKFCYGMLFIYINNYKFGEDSFFYPIDDEASSILEDTRMINEYPELFKPTASVLFSAFDYAFNNSPDELYKLYELYELYKFDFEISEKFKNHKSSFDLNSISKIDNKLINEIEKYLDHNCEIKKHMPNFLKEYIDSDQLAGTRLSIGNYSFRKYDTIFFHYKNEIRFLIKDENTKKMEGIIMDKNTYYRLWEDILEALN